MKKTDHLFYIQEGETCLASGYFDHETDSFYLTKDSMIALIEDPKYSTTDSAKARKRFIETSCIIDSSYYIVKKNSKCRSATAAACFVLGRSATYSAWKDIDGKRLKDVYPNYFIIDKENNIEGRNHQHLFYLKRDSVPERTCNITGYYDISTKKFIVLSGSIFSLDTAYSYKNTTSGTAREIFISKYCEKTETGFILTTDYIFDAPSTAASYALGRTANGWTEFKDEYNTMLNSVYR